MKKYKVDFSLEIPVSDDEASGIPETHMIQGNSFIPVFNHVKELMKIAADKLLDEEKDFSEITEIWLNIEEIK